MRGYKTERDGVEYLNFDRMKLKINVGGGKIHLSNLFGGDPILGELYIRHWDKITLSDYKIKA